MMLRKVVITEFIVNFSPTTNIIFYDRQLPKNICYYIRAAGGGPVMGGCLSLLTQASGYFFAPTGRVSPPKSNDL